MSAPDSHILRPTRLGVLMMLVTLAGLAAGFRWQNNGLLLLAACLAGLLVAAAILSWINLCGVTVTREVPYPLFAGRSFTNTVAVTNRKRWFPASLLLAEDSVSGAGAPRVPLVSGVAHLLPGETVEAWQRGTFYARGEKQFEAFTLCSTYPLGVFRAERRMAQSHPVVVYPRIRRVRRALLPKDPDRFRRHTVPILTARGEDEFAGLRDYRPGDNPKWIHWRSSGRFEDRLFVKEFEGFSLRRVTVILEAVVPDTRAPSLRRFERAVELTASMVKALTARRFVTRVRIVAAQTHQFEIVPHDRSFYALLHLLALLEPVVGSLPPGEGGGGARRGADPRLAIRPERLEARMAPEEALVWT